MAMADTKLDRIADNLQNIRLLRTFRSTGRVRSAR